MRCPLRLAVLFLFACCLPGHANPLPDARCKALARLRGLFGPRPAQPLVAFDAQVQALVLRPQSAPQPPLTDEAARIVKPSELDELRSQCEAWLAQSLGMPLQTKPVVRYDSLEQIQQAAGPDANGYTVFTITGERVQAVIHVPLHQRLGRTIHVFTHELAHVWTFERHLRVSRLQSEGISEWAAWHHLQSRGCTDEMAIISGNAVDIYAAGFRQLQGLSARLGLLATLPAFERTVGVAPRPVAP